MERFGGKVAIVTGSSAGIGAAISKELVKYGVIVVGLARRLDKLEKLAQELSKNEKNAKFHPLKCDLTKETDIENSFQWITSKLGPIAILINNAGTVERSLLADATAESITKTFDTNVKAAIRCSTLAVKNMTDNETKGHIININSIAGHRIPNLDPNEFLIYTSSKHALTVISEGLRRELVSKKSDIKVTNISPGPVYTEITGELPSSYTSKMILDTKDVADACITALNTAPDVVISELTIVPIRLNI